MKPIIILSAALGLTLSSTAFAGNTHTSANKTLQTKKYQHHIVLGKQKIQVALLMDTSSSMDGLIEQAKSQLWSIINELATAEYQGTKPSIEIALYHYGNSGLSSSNGYIQQIIPFTTDLDKVSEELFKMTTNGGDEYCGAVISDATLNLQWSESNEDLKLIYIAGNEPFNQGSVDYTKACRNAIAKGIVVNTIYCGGESEGINSSWKDGALLADGQFMSIDMNQQTVYIETPFDTTLLRLNNELNSTYVFYGSEGEVASTNQKNQDKNAESYSPSVSVERTVSKSSTGYINASWDLVDAARDSSFDISKVKDEELPGEMKNMDDIKRLEYIKDQSAKRDSIHTQINTINQQRQVFITEKKKENGAENSLDNAIVNSVHTVAKKKNYTFTKTN